MKYLLLIIILNSHCYCQDTTNVYKNLNKEERLLNQPSHNNDRIKDFKDKNPFHGELKSPNVPLDYSVDDKTKPQEYIQEDNPFRNQLDSWENVHTTPQAQKLRENNTPRINNYRQHSYIDWKGFIIATSVILFILIMGVFIYKLIK